MYTFLKRELVGGMREEREIGRETEKSVWVRSLF
jgi:hypothetical protein